MPAASFYWWNAVPWILSLGSMAFSYYVKVHGDNKAKAARKQAIAIRHFENNVCKKIYDAVEELEESMSALKSLEYGSFTKTVDLRSKVDEHNKTVAQAYGKLGDALESANVSKYTVSQNWLEKHEDRSDDCLARFDKCIDEKAELSIADIFTELQRVRATSKTHCNEIRSKIEDEIDNYLAKA